MPTESVISFVELLRQSRVLEPEQLDEVTRLQATLPDSRGLARELIQRGWLTPYQVNQIFQGKGSELTLGQYIIRERLGEGGMGLVFKAKHRRMDRIAAVKIIRKEHIAHADALRRFVREMQAVASLSHPNIVMAYDGDQIGDTHYLAMEFVDGTDLGTLLKKNGALPIATACDYLRQAALGLQHAHEKGLVHRDIKPSNLLITRNAERGPGKDSDPDSPLIKILDLGVARLHEPPGGLDSISALTKEGRVVGTPDFMAPEQAANSAKADIRSDLYSLGCTFYCMLAGRLPFPGGTPMEKLLKHRVDQATPIEQLRPEVPPGVAGILRKLMAKNPDERFQTPSELVQALDAVIAGGFSSPTLADPSWQGLPQAIPMRPTSARRWWLLAGLLLGAAFVGFAIAGIVYLAFGARKAPPAKTRRAAATDTVLHDLEARLADPQADIEAIQRDLVRYRQEHLGTLVAREAGRLLMRLPSPLDELRAEDVPAVERAPQRLPGLHEPSPFPPQVVAVLGQRGRRHWGPVQAAAVSPDGKWVATGGDDHSVRLWDARTMEELAVLSGHVAPVYWLGFTSDSHTLVSAGADRTLRFWRGFRPRVDEFGDWRIPIPERAPVALSPNGRTVAVALPGRAGQPASVRLIDLESINRPGGKPQASGTLPTPFRQDVQALAFNSAGKILAAAGDKGPEIHVWDMNPSPRPRTVLREGQTVVRSLAFSVEGSQLAAGTEGGMVHVYDLSKPSPGPPRVGRGEADFFPRCLAFTPGGSRLVIAGNDQVARLWDLAAAAPGRKEVQRFPGGLFPLAACLATGGSPTNPYVITGGLDALVRKWDLTQLLPVTPSWPVDSAGAGRSAAFLGSDRTVAASRDARPVISFWEPVRNRRREIPFAEVHGCWLAAAADGRTLAICSRSRPQVQLGRLGESGAFNSEELPPLSSQVSCLAIAPDGKAVAVGTHEGPIQVARVAEAKPWKWRQLGGHGHHPVRALAFRPDGKTLASAGADANLRFWDLEDGKEILGPVPAIEAVTLAFAPDGKTLATGGGRPGSSDLRLWELAGSQVKPRPIAWKRPHTQPVTAVDFTPNGERLISAGQDGRVILHNLISGEAVVSCQLAGPVNGLALAASGRYVATANGNGTVYVLRLIDPLVRR